MTDFEKLFGNNVKKYRKAKGLTQENLAEILGLTPEAISKIETGKRFVTSDTLTKIITALGIEEHELFLFKKLQSNDVIYKKILENLKSDKIKNNSEILALIYQITELAAKLK